MLISGGNAGGTSLDVQFSGMVRDMTRDRHTGRVRVRRPRTHDLGHIAANRQGKLQTSARLANPGYGSGARASGNRSIAREIGMAPRSGSVFGSPYFPQRQRSQLTLVEVPTEVRVSRPWWARPS